ncbi:MAG: protein kinase, partial [Gimesia sp.]|nr:protein kinase [Gimesia sp.]
MALTLNEFVTQLDESGIFSAADTATFQEKQDEVSKTAEDLARLLVEHKKVTRLQAKFVFQGKGKQLLLGNYLILEKIGAGGMGDVYLAEHRRMKRQVALKTLPAAMTKDSQSIQRFQREVQAAAKLTHPNIVAAYDADEAKGIHYFVMEYVEGIDLSAVVKKQGVLTVDVAVEYILQAAKGLEFAHNKGVIHRDIKPANMLLDNAGTIKILDMGLARIEVEAHEVSVTQLTQDGSVMGTVDYMAPEQAKDTHTADARSDIYSLGCSLYYLLTGESVYRGSTMVNRIMAHQNEPIPSLTGKHVHIPQDLDAVFQKMVAKKPEDRFQSMQEVIIAFEKCDLIKSSSSISQAPSDPELHKFLQSQRAASTPTIAMTADKPLNDIDHEAPTSGFLDNTRGGTAFEPLQKGKKSSGKRGWIVIGTVLASLILLAGIFNPVDTSEGTIVLDIDQPELAGAVVSVDDQKKTTIKTGSGTEPITVEAGKKTLTVAKGGFETFTKQFTVKAGGKEAIKVRLVPLTVATNNKKSANISSRENYALKFNGSGNVLISSLKIESPAEFTIEAIVKPENPQHGMIVCNAGRSGFAFKVFGNRWVFDGFGEVQKFSISSDELVTFNEWSHVAAVISGKQAKLFVNGQLQKTIARLDKLKPSTLPIVIGANPEADGFRDYLHGSIRAVRITDSARYSKSFNPLKSFVRDNKTVALYNFDEAEGDTLK